MKNITYIISQVNKSTSFELTAKLLDRKKFRLSFILMHDRNSALEDFLRLNNIRVDRVNYSSKKDLPSAVFYIRKFLKAHQTEIVHTHLFEGCLAGLVASRLAGIKTRIHTRHNSTIHHQYHKSTVKYDRLINLLSTKIVAVSATVKRVLTDLEGVSPEKINIIHHGFRMNEFNEIAEDRIQRLRTKYHLENKSHPVIGVISRYIHWKGIQYIISAFKKIRETYPEAHLILANAGGPYENEIKSLLRDLPVNCYTEIVFEEDVNALYKLFDIFVHTPIDSDSEAFGQVYVEALAAGIPSVFTLSGIAPDFISNKNNALIVDFKNSEEIEKAVIEIQNNKVLRKQLIDEGRKSALELFGIERMIHQLEELYEK
ncbi:MAG: glycosyltransferase family 4 protein [Bacteroidota bacterium]|nr:glycosyltransferase family 4 protein [Bacteroidota bacterium]